MNHIILGIVMQFNMHVFVEATFLSDSVYLDLQSVERLLMNSACTYRPR